MALSTEETVRETHRVALREAVKKELRTPEEFARFTGIEREAAKRADAERDAFRQDYQARLADARAVILREASGAFLNHPKPKWASDQVPSPEKIDLLARNRVQADHEKRLAAIRGDEVNQYRDLRTDCRTRDDQEARVRDRLRGRATDAFNTTNQISPHAAQSRGRAGPTQT